MYVTFPDTYIPRPNHKGSLTMALDTETEAQVSKLADILTPIVQAIELMSETTQHHYSDYMSAIEAVAQKLGENPTPKAVYLGIGLAMQRAGGNKNGIMHALRAMGHI